MFEARRDFSAGTRFEVPHPQWRKTHVTVELCSRATEQDRDPLRTLYHCHAKATWILFENWEGANVKSPLADKLDYRIITCDRIATAVLEARAGTSYNVVSHVGVLSLLLVCHIELATIPLHTQTSKTHTAPISTTQQPTMNTTMAGRGAFYTDDLGTSLRMAQAIGLTSTAFLAGRQHPIPPLPILQLTHPPQAKPSQPASAPPAPSSKPPHPSSPNNGRPNTKPTRSYLQPSVSSRPSSSATSPTVITLGTPSLLPLPLPSQSLPAHYFSLEP